MKQRVCYILPRYDERDATHFAYIADFLARAAQTLDIRLIIERGRLRQPPRAGLYVEHLLLGAVPLVRRFELGMRLVTARAAGYRSN